MRPIFAARPEVLPDLFFTTAAGALQTVAAVPRHLGAELGMIDVLHIWVRQLQHHPHIHFIIPGAPSPPTVRRDVPRGYRALPRAAQPWPSPPAVRRGVPRGNPTGCCRKPRLRAALRAAMDEALRHAAPDLHAQVPDSCWPDGWWGHWQPAGTGENVVKYLARYVRRTAISDERIVAMTDESVTFRYTDSATQARWECTLTADEFMRHYLRHMPPPGQHRVRYFGWMHPAAKRHRLMVEALLAVVIVVRRRSTRRNHGICAVRIAGPSRSSACGRTPHPARLRPMNARRLHFNPPTRIRLPGSVGRSHARVTLNPIQIPFRRPRHPSRCPFAAVKRRPCTPEPRCAPRLAPAPPAPPPTQSA